MISYSRILLSYVLGLATHFGEKLISWKGKIRASFRRLKVYRNSGHRTQMKLPFGCRSIL